jgi:hypothetical protein
LSHQSLPLGRQRGRRSWIARYVEQVRDRLASDPKESTLFLAVDGTPLDPDSLTEEAA